MRSLLPLALLLLIACDPTVPPEIACERTRADALEACAPLTVTVHRASCAQAARDEYGQCLIAAGELELGGVERCAAECTFMRVLCADAVVEIDCAAEQDACESACLATAPSNGSR